MLISKQSFTSCIFVVVELIVQELCLCKYLSQYRSVQVEILCNREKFFDKELTAMIIMTDLLTLYSIDTHCYIPATDSF